GEAAGKMVTVMDVLKGAAEFLERKQVECPRLNAEHLLAHVLGKKRLDLYLEFDRPLEESERAPMRELTRARGEGRPLQHLLGTADFMGHEFLCDARALIPRPETEQLVEFVLARLPNQELRVLDVGTGSGIIAITIALERPGYEMTGVDVSHEALELATANAAKLSATVHWISSDLVPAGGPSFHAIIANLPYIPSAEIPGLSREVQKDPLAALDGGEDGTTIIRRLISSAPSALHAGGLLALEVGTGQHEALVSCLEHHNFRDIEALPDYQGHIRFLFAKHG
ncbi:MAG: peptide chain release factor N(5)-glutamine methyltransferase, partial [Terrimicrobiaceae bacterium]